MVNKISLVGLGYIGKIHLRLIKESAEWALVGVFDSDPVLCRELAEKYNTRAFTSLDEAISNSQVVDIATPSNTHFEIAKKAIVAGKHVFIEKPVTSTLKEARLLRNLVAEAGIVFQVGHVERFNPAFVAALPYLDQPAFIEVHRLAQYNNRGTDVSVVLDLMMHDIDLILSIVNSNIKKADVSGTAVVSAEADIVNARLEFENGCVANITTNRVAFRNSRRFRVFCRDKLITINLLDKTTEIVRVKDAIKDSGNMVLDPGRGLPKKEIVFEHPVILPTNAINEELNTFHHSINSNKATKVGIDDAIRTLEIAFDIENKLRP